MDFQRAIDYINDSETIAILPHVSADGDSLGSTLALYLALKDCGKKTVIFVEEPIQKRYIPVTRDGNFVIFSDDTVIVEYDLCIAVDCGDKARLGKRADIFDKACKRVSIDHHQSNTNFAEINLVDTNWSATAEGIYYLIKQMGINIDKGIAQALYTGIFTDTGGFRHSNTTPETHMITAEIMKTGIDVKEISQQVYDSISIGRLKLNGVIAEKTEFYCGGKIALCYVSNEILEKCGASEEDIDGLCDNLRNIEGVEVGIIFKDTKNGSIKVNLRSKCYVDVNVIAQDFNGGGHKRAAGMISELSFEELRSKLISRIEVVI